MKVKTINYSESREAANEIGLKTWFRYGIEIEVEDGEDANSVAEIARETVKNWHKKDNPTSYFQPSTELPVIQSKDR